jgi:hypothetical protein
MKASLLPSSAQAPPPLKPNATEDLLVNGQREPSERGVCRHLIGRSTGA